MLRAVAGAIVEQSSTTAPLPTPAAMPSSPSTIASTSGESETQRHDELGARAASRGVAGALRPARRERLLALARAVVDCQLVPGVEQVPRHELAHRAETDPCNLHARQARWSAPPSRR